MKMTTEILKHRLFVPNKNFGKNIKEKNAAWSQKGTISGIFLSGFVKYLYFVWPWIYRGGRGMVAGNR